MEHILSNFNFSVSFPCSSKETERTRLGNKNKAEEENAKEDYDNKTTEVNGKLNPIMMKVYSEGGSSEMPESVPVGVSEEGVPEDKPTIDEID